MGEMKICFDKSKLKQISATYGYEAQCRKLLEEMRELKDEVITSMVSDDNNISNIVEECADVLIMIAQIQLLLDVPADMLDHEIKYKIDRQIRRIESAERKGEAK